MGAVAAKTFADLRHRRLQAAVLAAVLFLAAGAATLALSILVETNEPFDTAFARANGAHLVIDYAGGTSDAALARTATATGVTASAGPWPVAFARMEGKGRLVGNEVVSGRPAPDASIDNVAFISGRWWQAHGEIVLDQDAVARLNAGLGDRVSLYVQPDVPGKDLFGDHPAGVGAPKLAPPAGDPVQAPPAAAVTLTVVGIAASVSTPDVTAWISPTDLATVASGAAPVKQMLYRVDPATNAADRVAAAARITANLPADAVVSTVTDLDLKTDVDQIAQLYVPVLLAFSIFALLAAAFTIANVVGGIVLTSYRDIGVMKAVGFTPSQVTAILVGQILAPVTVGAIAGVIAGTIASQPTVQDVAQSFGLPATFALSWSVVAVVIAVSIGVALVAALGPAIHAGRLAAVTAIARGTAPSRRGDGGRLRRLGLRLPIGIPGRLGVAAGVAHPARAAMTLGALIVGVGAVTFAYGLNQSLLKVMTQLDRSQASPVRVELRDPTANAAAISSTIAAQPGTGHAVAIGQLSATVRGLGEVPFVGYDGDASWTGYELIAGRWFAGQGEAVAPTIVFTQTGLHLGDTIELANGGRSSTVRLVGEIFDTADESPDHLILRGAWSDLLALDPTVRPTRWEVQPTAGTSPGDYSAALETATDQQVAARPIDGPTLDEGFLLFLSVITFMGIVLVAISFGGVFDTVLLETRQRTRELAVLKALGLTPRQVIAMVVASVVPAGLVAGLLGVPLGMAFQRAALGYMGQVAAQTRIPDSTFDVYGPAVLVGLALTGLAIAIAGAFLPAQRAARTLIAPVLQAE